MRKYLTQRLYDFVMCSPCQWPLPSEDHGLVLVRLTFVLWHDECVNLLLAHSVRGHDLVLQHSMEEEEHVSPMSL